MHFSVHRQCEKETVSVHFGPVAGTEQGTRRWYTGVYFPSTLDYLKVLTYSRNS